MNTFSVCPAAQARWRSATALSRRVPALFLDPSDVNRGLL
jgi:hypothetical protein